MKIKMVRFYHGRPSHEVPMEKGQQYDGIPDMPAAEWKALAEDLIEREFAVEVKAKKAAKPKAANVVEVVEK